MNETIVPFELRMPYPPPIHRRVFLQPPPTPLDPRWMSSHGPMVRVLRLVAPRRWGVFEIRMDGRGLGCLGFLPPDERGIDSAVVSGHWVHNPRLANFKVQVDLHIGTPSPIWYPTADTDLGSPTTRRLQWLPTTSGWALAIGNADPPTNIISPSEHLRLLRDWMQLDEHYSLWAWETTDNRGAPGVLVMPYHSSKAHLAGPQ